MSALPQPIHEYELDPIEHSGESVENVSNTIARGLVISLAIGLVVAISLVVGAFYLFG